MKNYTSPKFTVLTSFDNVLLTSNMDPFLGPEDKL